MKPSPIANQSTPSRSRQTFSSPTCHLPGLQELHDGDLPVAGDAADHHAEGGGGLALAVTGVHEDDAPHAPALRVDVLGGHLGPVGIAAVWRSSRTGRTTGWPPSWMMRTRAP